MKICRNIANVITGTRIILAIMMFCMSPFSLSFWICYIGAGVTDMIDGFVARKLNQQSEFGAKLDSIADFIFAICLFMVMIRNITFSRWVWIVVGIIALLRFVSYGIGYVKYHTFASLHTYLNKMTGMSGKIIYASIYSGTSFFCGWTSCRKTCREITEICEIIIDFAKQPALSYKIIMKTG